jgi:ubiquinone/menaquinone biosynthesis C-methylase UbiE
MGEHKIAQFYDSDVEREWTRLDRHRMEFAVTSRALAEYLPRPEVDDICRVLDCGGGPGRYSMLLTSLGYRVTLLDLSAASLEFAQRKAENLALEIADYVHASATDLSMFEDRVNQLEGPSWDAWADLNYRCASDPSVHGGAEHLLYIGRRR